MKHMVDNFEIVHEAYLILVSGSVPPYGILWNVDIFPISTLQKVWLKIPCADMGSIGWVKYVVSCLE